MQRCQGAGYNAKENAGTGAHCGKPARWLAVIGYKKLRHSGESAGTQRLGVKKRHDKQRDTTAQGEPPCGDAQLKAQLGRAHGGCTAHDSADNAAGHYAHTGAAPADVIVVGGFDAPGGNDAGQHGQNQCQHQANQMNHG